MTFSTNDIISELHKNFQGASFEYLEVDYLGKIPAFFIKIDSEPKLSEQWLAIVDFIAVNFQSLLTDEFAIWNIYLFFILPREILHELKYIIENNTFSSRKIVIESVTPNEKIIDDHIVNMDLVFGAAQHPGIIFTHNDLLWDILENKEAKKKITDEDKEIFKKIIRTVKKRANEN
ncbi:hypothetical protein QF042_003776 [Pedobacter sp. W3I1]|uniref:ABC-three component system middle component 1 n=1 Tax=Pedobacter sp. W3I1 TaxID=3042291 RepID=UPI00277EA555|nr:ABC-three component system middle component 1 [Pedobacter sp. W3I1]MDQ0640211.1 hypothetical protein [Pedobacter sp. W3I1]